MFRLLLPPHLIDLLSHHICNLFLSHKRRVRTATRPPYIPRPLSFHIRAIPNITNIIRNDYVDGLHLVLSFLRFWIHGHPIPSLTSISSCIIPCIRSLSPTRVHFVIHTDIVCTVQLQLTLPSTLLDTEADTSVVVLLYTNSLDFLGMFIVHFSNSTA